MVSSEPKSGLNWTDQALLLDKDDCSQRSQCFRWSCQSGHSALKIANKTVDSVVESLGHCCSRRGRGQSSGRRCRWSRRSRCYWPSRSGRARRGCTSGRRAGRGC